VGLTNALSKLVTYRLLEPVLGLPGPVQIECREDTSERLLAALALHDVDVVLSDAPADPAVKVQAYSHLLGESGVVVFGTGQLVRAHRRGFPRSLDGAPFILPTEETAVRRMVDAWFDAHSIRPRVVGEFDDSALSKAFGSAGVGLFFAPSAIAREVRRQYGVEVVGRPRTPRLRYYAISVERRLRHPAVTAIFQAARADLFA
jgi:LysR family transcriptional activator of nhaA